LETPFPQIPLPGAHTAQQVGRTETVTPDDYAQCEKRKITRKNMWDAKMPVHSHKVPSKNINDGHHL